VERGDSDQVQGAGGTIEKPGPSEIGPFVCLFGPTAVGKTDVITRLAERAQQIEVVGADSVQIYRGLDIGSAKPSGNLRSRVPHHLIDIRNPDEHYDVGDFVRDAETAISDIRSRGGFPIVTGGTAFYFRNLIFGLPETPASDPAIRDELASRLSSDGLPALRDELRRVDPESVKRIGENDSYRTLRALEVYRLSGMPLSRFKRRAEPRRDIRALILGLDRDRAELYEFIDRRVEMMFEAGLAAEVHALQAAGYGRDAPAMRAIGYREFFAVEQSRENIRAEIKKNSRRYAKRQLTFFRSLPGVEWFHTSDVDRLLSRVVSFFEEAA
jgi:tRNA dimethylallyltransferase